MDCQVRARCEDCLDLLVRHDASFAAAFFALLFTRAPEIRFLFPKNIENAEVQVDTVFQMARAVLGDQDLLHTKLRVFGFRMGMRGLHREHFEIFANTLIGTMKRQLHGSWHPEFERMWFEIKRDALSSLDEGARMLAA